MAAKGTKHAIMIFALAIVALLFALPHLIFVPRTSQEVPQETPTVSDRTIPPSVTVDLVMVGDILLHDAVISSGLQPDGSYDYTNLFAHVADEIAGADVAIVNQETPLAGPERGYAEVDIPLYSEEEVEEMGGPWWMYVVPLFNSPDAVADAEVAAGFDVVLKAQNHVYDQGLDGISRELAFWNETYPQIAVLGVTDPYDPASAKSYKDDIYVYEKDGFRIAVLNFTEFINSSYGDDAAIVSLLSDDRIYADVARAREKGADMIVACPHWGTEYQVYEDAEQAHYAQVMADAGVDVIFGTHPHVPENVEVLTGAEGNTCVCFYSNGNFVTANTTPDCMLTGLSEVTLEKSYDGTCRIVEARFLPAVVHGGDGMDMTTYLLRDWTDEIASTSWAPLYPDWVKERFAQILGEGFDPVSCVYTAPLPE